MKFPQQKLNAEAKARRDAEELEVEQEEEELEEDGNEDEEQYQSGKGDLPDVPEPPPKATTPSPHSSPLPVFDVGNVTHAQFSSGNDMDAAATIKEAREYLAKQGTVTYCHLSFGWYYKLFTPKGIFLTV